MSETTTEREWHEISVGDYVVAWRRSLGDSSIAQVLIGDESPDEWWPVALLEALSAFEARAQAATGLYAVAREVRDWADNWELIPKEVLEARDWERVMLAVRKAIADYEEAVNG